jgi:hypothetical protein
VACACSLQLLSSRAHPRLLSATAHRTAAADGDGCCCCWPLLHVDMVLTCCDNNCDGPIESLLRAVLRALCGWGGFSFFFSLSPESGSASD